MRVRRRPPRAQDSLEVGYLAKLVRAVAVLALDANGQRAWLDGIGTAPSTDELALELGDGALLLPQMVQNGWIGKDFAEAVATLDAALDAIPAGEHHAWTVDGLNAAPWTEIRKLARAALFTL